MKYIVNKENILKGASVCLVVLVLLVSSLSVMANSAMDKSKRDIQTNKSSYMLSPLSVVGYETILDENFNDATPPYGWPPGWENRSMGSSDDTWYIDATYPNGGTGYCGTCYHDKNLQDEWLTTPTLNFTGYTEIYLRFMFYTSYYEAVKEDYHDLNVSISIDGGENWELIWNEDNLDKFISWVWYSSEPIVLSDYNNKTDVTLRFQYYSAEGVEGLEYSIDDIIVYGNSSEFECEPGEDLTYHWDYQPVDFRHVYAVGGEKPYRWEWNFDDNETGIFPPILTRHYYDKIGEYNVLITVRDNGKLIAFANVNVSVVTGDPSTIQINVNKSGIGIDVEFINTGTENLSYIDWNLSIQYGPLKTLDKKIANGTIEKLPPNTPRYINSEYFFGFGRINILISATPEGAPAPPQQRFKAFKIGPFVLNARRG